MDGDVLTRRLRSLLSRDLTGGNSGGDGMTNLSSQGRAGNPFVDCCGAAKGSEPPCKKNMQKEREPAKPNRVFLGSNPRTPPLELNTALAFILL